MELQVWDDVLYPVFRATIRGEYYGHITRDHMDEECYYLAKRAIQAFKFPKISTNYTTFYAIRIDDNTLQEVEDPDKTDEIPMDEGDIENSTKEIIPHAYFHNQLTYAEIEILVAWMKVYWFENQISNADNFEDLYTDVNIKTYSRANAVDKNLKLIDTYRKYARNLENAYSRTTSTKKSAMGGINSDE